MNILAPSAAAFSPGVPGRRYSLILLLVCTSGLAMYLPVVHAQREFRVYESFEGYDSDVELPVDYMVPGELVIGRLMYPSSAGFGRRWWRGGDWQQGGTSWAVDYPRGDRTMARLLRRFSSINVRSVEQPVNLDDGDDVYYWPFLMVGLAGYWDLTDGQVLKLRDYLMRGGILFCDSFFGSDSWIGFVHGMQRILPDRHIIDLPAEHPVFHTVYDLSGLTRTQIPNMNSLLGGGGGYLGDGAIPHWRGIVDDNGRLMVLIAFNNDVADSWQWADDARYPHESVNLGLRFAVNIAVYTMTH